MAVRIDASGDYLRRTANLPAINSFSMCCWFYYTASMSAWAYVLGMEDAAESSGNWCLLGLDGSNNFHIANFTAYSFFASNPATGAWHFVALTGDATTITGYHRTAAGVWQTPVTLPLITFTPAALWFGNDSYSERINGRIAAMKVWSATLTQAEIELEAATIRPHRFSNLNLWCPGFPGAGERSRDYSGNGYNLTEGGTLTDEDGPPVSYGASVWVLPFVEVGGGTTYNMTFSATGVSATANDADLPVLRSLAATATATTATTDAATLNTATVFSLALAAQAATTTGDTATAAILRSIAQQAQAVTDTPAIDLGILRLLLVSSQAATATAEAQIAILRAIVAGATAGTLTSDVTLNLAAVIAAAMVATVGSDTAEASANVLRSMDAQVAGDTATAGAIVSILYRMAVDVGAQSKTAEAQTAILRALAATAETGTQTNVVTLNLAAVLALALAATGVTETAESSVTVLRSASAQVAIDTETAEAIVGILRGLIVDVGAQSKTAEALVAVQRVLYHDSVASTATGEIDFRTEASVGLLRLIVSGALHPAVTASGRRPFIVGE